MAKHSGPAARGLLSAHNTGAGKGDATRTNFASPAWQNNFREIAWPNSSEGFVRAGRRLRKVYGVPATPKRYSPEELESAGITWWTNKTKRLP